MDKQCDLVMKGGVTSGVIYPRAVIDLSKSYKFRQIGGASAGAIAAAFAAAAEANRQGGGFDRLAKIPGELENRLGNLFQPYPRYRRIFHRVMKAVDGGGMPGVWFFIRNFFALRKALKRLPENVFGVCPGTTTAPENGPALIDWMNRQLEYVAVRIQNTNDTLPTEPLTFGMLQAKGVELRLITTNLSQRRPENLPIRRGFRVSRKDLEWLMPKNVADWIICQDDGDSDLVRVPCEKDMPVLLAVRLSLSFPVLFSAVPLYRPDDSLRITTGKCEGANEEQRRNLFSDGGLSSNFPIHYFDASLPVRPTFAINLTEYHECRNGDATVDWNRIYMPAKAGGGLTYTINPIEQNASFLGALLSAAKDWQDAMQTRMPGYRERVVHVALTEEEGGLNLHMDQEKIRKLTGYGALAAERIVNGHELDPGFSFDVHRWRRLLSITDALEKALDEMVDGYSDPSPSGDPSLGSMKERLADLAERDRQDPIFTSFGYPPRNRDDLQNLIGRWEALVALREQWKQLPLSRNWHPPRPRAGVKFRPREL